VLLAVPFDKFCTVDFTKVENQPCSSPPKSFEIGFLFFLRTLNPPALGRKYVSAFAFLTVFLEKLYFFSKK